MYVDGSLGEWLNLSTQGNALRQIYIDSFDYEIFYESRGLFLFFFIHWFQMRLHT